MTPDRNSGRGPRLSSSLAISIVSHGQGDLVKSLLADLRPLASSGEVQVIVTLNFQEPEQFLTEAGYDITVIRNAHVKGFGANHNQAFANAHADFFAVLNPDVRLQPEVFPRLLQACEDATIGVCAPAVVAPNGRLEDNARKFPTLARVARRMVSRSLRRPTLPDYSAERGFPQEVDWVAGMFMLFRSAAFASVHGFDERYFMYLEDADICRRLWKRGWRVIISRESAVVHDARRATLHSFRHFKWHVTSLGKFLMASLGTGRVPR